MKNKNDQQQFYQVEFKTLSAAQAKFKTRSY